MSHNPIDIHVWPAENTGDDAVTAAINTLENDMDPELDFDLDAYDESHHTPYDSTDDDNWDEVKSGFVIHVRNYYGKPDNNEAHLIIVNRTFDALGAGKAWGDIGRGNIWTDSDAAVTGVNVGVNAYAEGLNCQSGHGTDVFKNTVIHEVGYCLLRPALDVYDAPAQNCDQSHRVDHSLGGLDHTKTNDVTPMQTWYTPEICDDNPRCCVNCTQNSDHSNIDYATQTLTLCASHEMENYYDATF